MSCVTVLVPWFRVAINKIYATALYNIKECSAWQLFKVTIDEVAQTEILCMTFAAEKGQKESVSNRVTLALLPQILNQKVGNKISISVIWPRTAGGEYRKLCLVLRCSYTVMQLYSCTVLHTQLFTALYSPAPSDKIGNPWSDGIYRYSHVYFIKPFRTTNEISRSDTSRVPRTALCSLFNH